MPDNDGDCRFYRDGNLTIFETPSPYFDNMYCTQNVTCSNPNHTVHYEFEYFSTESCCDKLNVNDVVYRGSGPQDNEWIDSYTSRVDLVFRSDGSITERGFKMKLKCDDPSSPEPTSNEETTASTYDECFFEGYQGFDNGSDYGDIYYGDSGVFDTGDPYRNNMRQGFSIEA